MLRRPTMSTPGKAGDDVGEEKETGRVEAFSDGVFSVAITLLVFQLAVPTVAEVRAGGHPITAVLANDAAAFVAYALSFLTILVMWMNHHSVFAFVYRLDRAFVLFNGLLLMLVVFVNFPTALVATYVSAGTATEAKIAAGVLSGTFVVISIIYQLLWHRATDGRRLVGARTSQTAIDTLSAQYRFGAPLYVLALALAFVNAWASIAVNAGLAVYFALAGQFTAPEEATADTTLATHGDAARDSISERHP